jgi:4-hydroxy-3-polyprenylbenzoate decarboxylase
VSPKRRIIVAITGASGSIYGVRLLQMLAEVADVESHLILSRAGRLTLAKECQFAPADIAKFADVVHAPSNIGASISSGSYRVHAMIIAPCSIRTASSIACGITDELISRAADVILKERRRLVIAIRETPLHQGHLETLAKLAGLGAIIFPPVPSFYHEPKTIDAIVDQTCMRILDQLDVEIAAAPRWGEADGIVAVGDSEV